MKASDVKTFDLVAVEVNENPVGTPVVLMGRVGTVTHRLANGFAVFGIFSVTGGFATVRTDVVNLLSRPGEVAA